ncbi:CCA tRNA nucleotidyltransferase, partial [Chloroflexota bacterium]
MGCAIIYHSKMPDVINLADRIKKQLPAALTSFLPAAGEIAERRGQALYLVGGVVRDLLLGRNNLDLDLIVDGDAINLAQQLNRRYRGSITTHPRFGTAKLEWDGWSVDLITARSETYARPGALPRVAPGTLASDLARRDFTINTLAVCLNPDRYGELIDRHGGVSDLEKKLIRILHENSFVDDATRIWRGLRYEQRLDFTIEAATLKLLKRNIPRLGTISGDRIRHELELVLKEELPEKALRHAGELGVLNWLHPSLRGDGWLAERFRQARELSTPQPPSVGLYLTLLAYRLDDNETKALAAKLRLPKTLTGTLKDTASIKAMLSSLCKPGLPHSGVHAILHGKAPAAITANLLATETPAAQERIRLFLGKLRY